MDNDPSDPLNNKTEPGYRVPTKAGEAEKPKTDTNKTTIPKPINPDEPAPAPADGAASSDSPYPYLRPPAEPDEIGRIANYRILKVLGSGGMGMVFQAEDMVLRRGTALKVMRPEMKEVKDAGTRMLREARAMAAIKHDNLISIYQAGQERDVVYIAMELLEGETLERRLARITKFDAPDVIRIARETASGLAAIHAQGLIHRDIKPSNIWLEGPKQTVKILDFGLARSIDTSAQTVLTQQGLVIGTPAYMSPEQARGVEVGPATDLFSLGCALYEMCTGNMPFQGNSVIAQLTALAVENPRMAHEVNTRIPIPLSLLIAQLLEKDPKKRPASAKELVEKLNALERGSNATTFDRPIEPVPVKPRAAGPAPRSMAPILGVGVALLVLGIGVYAFWMGQKSDKVANAVPEAKENKPSGALVAPIDKPATPEPKKTGPENERPPRQGDRPPPPDDPPDDRGGPPRGGPPGGPQLKDDQVIALQAEHDKPGKATRAFTMDLPMKDLYSVYFPRSSGKANVPGDRPPPNAFRMLSVQGKPAGHSIGMHPDPEGQPRMTFTLDKKYATFSAIVSQNDNMHATEADVVFLVYGDKKELWKSKPVNSQAESQRCVVSVKDVNELRLEIRAGGDFRGAHMIWYEPYVE